MIRGQVWDRQEHLELERQEARGVGKGTIGPKSLFENFDVGSFEIELKESYQECETAIRTATHPFIDLGLRVRFRSGSSSVND